MHLHFVAKQKSLPFYLQRFFFLCKSKTSLIYAMEKLVINCMQLNNKWLPQCKAFNFIKWKNQFIKKSTHTHTGTCADLCMWLQFLFDVFGLLAQADLIGNLTVHRWFVSFIELVLWPYLDVYCFFFSQINFPELNGVPWDADELKWIKFLCSSNYK